jgi:hypothetical protein
MAVITKMVNYFFIDPFGIIWSVLFPHQLNPFLPGRLTGRDFPSYPKPKGMSTFKVVMLKTRIHPMAAAVRGCIPQIPCFSWNRITIILFRIL